MTREETNKAASALQDELEVTIELFGNHNDSSDQVVRKALKSVLENYKRS